MKKISRIAALLAAGALLFGFAACSDGGSNGGGGDPDPDPENESTTYAWTFNDITVSDIGAEALSSGDYSGKYVLAADYKYDSTPSGVRLTMCKGDAKNGYVYNSIDPEKTIGESSQTVIYGKATKGAIEPAGDLVNLVNVQGPFTVLAYVSSNSSSDKTDRYAYIKLGADGEEAEVYAPTKNDKKVPVAGQILEYSYEGTDKVNVIIGCEKYLRIYDVQFTTAVTQDQSSNVAFNAQTKDLDISLSTFGLIGATVTSSDETIATATLADSKITATSVKEGVATLTVKDTNNKEATVKVIVAEDGTVTFGTITKFTRSAPVLGEKTNATTSSSTDGSATATYDGLTDVEFSENNEIWVDASDAGVTVNGTSISASNLRAGTYYVRGKASDAYEASAVLTVVIGDASAATTTDSWTIADISAFSALTSKGTLTADIEVDGASGNLVLTATKSGTDHGTTKSNDPTYQYVANKGLLIKNDAIKIAGIKGSVTLTVKWYCNSADTEETSSSSGTYQWKSNRRKLEISDSSSSSVTEVSVKDVNGGTEDSPTQNGAKGAQADITYEVDGGTEGVDVYIGASNELYLQSITIE